MFGLLSGSSAADDHTPSTEEVAHVTEMLTRTQAGGAYEAVLAKRVGQLHARLGSSVYETLTAIDDALLAAERGIASKRVGAVAVEAWAHDVLALSRGVCDEPLTGLTRAENLHAHMEQGDAGHLMLVAEVFIDERDQRARGALQSLEAELSLGLVHAVLDHGVSSCAPWARLGERRLGTAVLPTHGVTDDVGDSVAQARRWLSRWRHDLDVAAWIEPVPVGARARGLLMRDLAM